MVLLLLFIDYFENVFSKGIKSGVVILIVNIIVNKELRNRNDFRNSCLTFITTVTVAQCCLLSAGYGLRLTTVHNNYCDRNTDVVAGTRSVVLGSQHYLVTVCRCLVSLPASSSKVRKAACAPGSKLMFSFNVVTNVKTQNKMF